MTITTDTQHLSSNNQPIMPTDSLQYRAIGRLWVRDVPSFEQIYKGKLITARQSKIQNLSATPLSDTHE